MSILEKYAKLNSESCNVMNNIIDEIVSHLAKYIDINKYSIRLLDKRNRVSQRLMLSMEDTPKFIVKIMPNKSYIRTYELIESLYKKGAPFTKPLCGFKLTDTGDYCLVTYWAEGSEIVLSNMPNRDMVYPYSCTLANILHKLHDIRVDKNFLYVHMETELKLYLKTISDLKIDFCYKNEILNYIQNERISSINSIGYVHMDLHRENIIWSKCGEATLIDYETIMVTDTYREFVYAVGFHDHNEDIFWMATIWAYFNGRIPEDFWRKMRYYCFIQLLRMVIFEKKENNQEKIDWLCRSLYRTYDDLKSIEPQWFVKFKPFLRRMEHEMKCEIYK